MESIFFHLKAETHLYDDANIITHTVSKICSSANRKWWYYFDNLPRFPSKITPDYGTNWFSVNAGNPSMQDMHLQRPCFECLIRFGNIIAKMQSHSFSRNPKLSNITSNDYNLYILELHPTPNRIWHKKHQFVKMMLAWVIKICPHD